MPNVPSFEPSRCRSTHTGFPVAAFSANAVVGESPNTSPSVMATPSGPRLRLSGESTRYSHSSLPVARDRAYTLAARSWKYTTPFCTIGVTARDPKPGTPVTFPVSLKVQASRRLVTFAEEMVESGASRVLARSAFGYGQDPDATGTVAAALAALGATKRPVPMRSANASWPHRRRNAGDRREG